MNWQSIIDGYNPANSLDNLIKNLLGIASSVLYNNNSLQFLMEKKMKFKQKKMTKLGVDPMLTLISIIFVDNL